MHKQGVLRGLATYATCVYTYQVNLVLPSMHADIV